MSGAISGGWEYVIAAYAVTWVVLGGYAAWVFVGGAVANDLLRRNTEEDKR